MALLTNKEFAEKCGISTDQLTVYKGRGKVVMGDDGLYDDQHPANQKQHARCMANAAKRAEKPSKPENEEKEEKSPSPEKPEKKPKNQEKTPEKAGKSRLNAELSEKFKIENELKKKQSERQEAETRMLKMKEDRIMGQLLPTALIKPLFQRHFQSITMEFQNTVNALITDVSAKTKLNRNVQAELRKKVISDVNIAIDRAIFHTEKEIDNMINEYVESRQKAA